MTLPRSPLVLLALALALAPLAGCQSHATVSADCDQLLNEEKYTEVIDTCDNPVDLASAYMGLGGFDMFLLVDDTAADGKVAAMLGLTAANVDQRRKYFNSAVSVVNPPQGASQAFALLVSAFLGLSVTTQQYLDNGITNPVGPVIDPSLALDDEILSSETLGAVSFQASGGFGLVIRDSVNHYAVRYGGKSYIIDCTGATNPCGSGGTLPTVYDDPNGTGILNTTPGESADKGTLLGDLAGITSAGRIVQMENADIGFELSSATEEPTKSYLGREPAPVTYNMGLSTYLTALNRATAELEESTGSSGGSEVTDQIDAITEQLDNGGTCSGSTVQVDQLGKVYLAAVGTLSTPAPSTYGNANLVAIADIANLIAAAPVAFPTVIPATLDFTVSYYKMIYATQALAGYDLTKATARVDAADATLQENFENVWLFSPGGSAMGDNQVNVAEVICSAD